MLRRGIYELHMATPLLMHFSLNPYPKGEKWKFLSRQFVTAQRAHQGLLLVELIPYFTDLSEIPFMMEIFLIAAIREVSTMLLDNLLSLLQLSPLEHKSPRRRIKVDVEEVCGFHHHHQPSSRRDKFHFMRNNFPALK